MARINAKVAGKIVTPLGYDGEEFQNIPLDLATGSVSVQDVEVRDLEDSGQLYHYGHVMVGAGDYILDGHTVAPDTVFVLTALAAYNGNGATGAIWLGARLAGLNRWFKYQAVIAAAVVVFWGGRLYCQEDTIIRSLFAGVNNGNLLMFDYSGYTLEV